LASLHGYWHNLNVKLNKEQAVHKSQQDVRLKKIAQRTIAGMIGCWVAQWVWWIGFVKLYGDL